MEAETRHPAQTKSTSCQIFSEESENDDLDYDSSRNTLNQDRSASNKQKFKPAKRTQTEGED